jgi:hypothetical protein
VRLLDQTITDTVNKFAEKMDLVLQKKAEVKTGWTRLGDRTVIHLMMGEFEEILELVIKPEDRELLRFLFEGVSTLITRNFDYANDKFPLTEDQRGRLQREAVDLANIAMMLQDPNRKGMKRIGK